MFKAIGFKLEFIIVIAIISIFALVSMVNLAHKKYNKEPFTKELEFTDTVLTEVDMHIMHGRAFGTYGVRNSGVLTLHQLQYYTKEMESIYANRGVFKDNKLYLNGNIILHNKEGFTYRAEDAVYNKNTKILDVTSNFIGKMHQNVVKGNTLRYDMKNDVVLGKQIEAVVYTVKK